MRAIRGDPNKDARGRALARELKAFNSYRLMDNMDLKVIKRIVRFSGSVAFLGASMIGTRYMQSRGGHTKKHLKIRGNHG